jgi:hypothetical protein
MPIIPALRRPRQEDHEFEASLCYIARPCLKTNKKQTNNVYLISKVSILTGERKKKPNIL